MNTHFQAQDSINDNAGETAQGTSVLDSFLFKESLMGIGSQRAITPDEVAMCTRYLLRYLVVQKPHQVIDSVAITTLNFWWKLYRTSRPITAKDSEPQTHVFIWKSRAFDVDCWVAAYCSPSRGQLCYLAPVCQEPERWGRLDEEFKEEIVSRLPEHISVMLLVYLLKLVELAITQQPSSKVLSDVAAQLVPKCGSQEWTDHVCNYLPIDYESLFGSK